MTNLWLRLLGLESGTDVHRLSTSTWQATETVPPAVWWTVVLLGLALALVNFLPQVAMRWRVRLGTAVLRLAMTGLLLVVLYGVEWQLTLEVNEPQEWLVLMDDSASMATLDVNGKSRWAAALDDLARLRELANGRVRLDVATVSGQPVGAAAGPGPTEFRAAIQRTALSRHRLDRLLLLTDGRDSERRDLRELGEDLAARGAKVSVRLYGAATPPRDSGITAIPESSLLRLGEELVIRGTISGTAPPAEYVVTLKENGRQVRTLAVPPEDARRFVLRYAPKKEGWYTYAVELPTSDAVRENNVATFTVQVVKEKVNVLMIEGFPRFEYKLLKTVLEVDPLVSLVSVCHLPGGGVYVQGEPLHRNPEEGLVSSEADLFKYDVVILRDVPRSYFRAGGDTGESRLRYLVEFVEKRGGGLLVLGGQDVFRAGGYEGSHLAEVLPFDLTDKLSGKAQFDGMFFVAVPKAAYAHPLLQLLPSPDANRERLNALRQLDGSNNVGRFKPLATPLLTRLVALPDKTGKPVEREVPIVAAMAVGDGKVIAAAVDTFWRWQLQADFDDPPLTALLANVVRYLAPPPGRKPDVPDVTPTDDTPQVGQELLLTTELKDKNFDPIANAELLVTVRLPDGQSRRLLPRDLPEEPGLYRYRVRLDAPGLYQVRAKYGTFEAFRELYVGAATGEFAELSPDREGVGRLLKAAGGEEVPDVEKWGQTADWQPGRREAARDLAVWNSPLVLLLFILLLSADCYLRKRQGLA